MNQQNLQFTMTKERRNCLKGKKISLISFKRLKEAKERIMMRLPHHLDFNKFTKKHKFKKEDPPF